MVADTQLAHLFHVVKISSIDDDRLLERPLHPLEIGVAILVPVSDHYQRVGSGKGLIVSLSVIYSVAEDTPGLLNGGWVVSADASPPRRAARR